MARRALGPPDVNSTRDIAAERRILTGFSRGSTRLGPRDVSLTLHIAAQPGIHAAFTMPALNAASWLNAPWGLTMPALDAASWLNALQGLTMST